MASTAAMRFEMKKVSVSNPIVTGVSSKEDQRTEWKLEGMNSGQSHEHFERLGVKRQSVAKFS